MANLFDEENAPPSRRSEKVLRTIRNDIAGWTPELRDRKIAQLASVIVQMNDGNAPDLLGVCEVENRFVLDGLVDAVKGFLPTRSYDVVHADTDDVRIGRLPPHCRRDAVLFPPAGAGRARPGDAGAGHG